jgi:hypothetical protein
MTSKEYANSVGIFEGDGFMSCMGRFVKVCGFKENYKGLPTCLVDGGKYDVEVAYLLENGWYRMTSEEYEKYEKEFYKHLGFYEHMKAVREYVFNRDNQKLELIPLHILYA